MERWKNISLEEGSQYPSRRLDSILKMSEKISSSLDSKEASVSIVQESPKPQKINGSSGVLAGGGSVELYAPIAEYEGKHRYDPTAEWTEKEEKVLVRRVNCPSHFSLPQI